VRSGPFGFLNHLLRRSPRKGALTGLLYLPSGKSSGRKIPLEQENELSQFSLLLPRPGQPQSHIRQDHKANQRPHPCQKITEHSHGNSLFVVSRLARLWFSDFRLARQSRELKKEGEFEAIFCFELPH